VADTNVFGLATQILVFLPRRNVPLVVPLRKFVDMNAESLAMNLRVQKPNVKLYLMWFAHAEDEQQQ
jgi:hypothetical protein